MTELEKELLKALKEILPFADEWVSEQLNDGAVGMGEDLQKIFNAQDVIKKAEAQP